MAVARIHHDNNYTCISNAIFKDTSLSIKAKGLLCTMLSLSDNWNYSIKGLATLSNDGETSIRSAIKELEEHNYVKRTPVREGGRIIDWEYDIYESPQLDTEILDVENPTLETLTLDAKDNKIINNKITNNKIIKENSVSKDTLCEQPNNNFNFGSTKTSKTIKVEQAKKEAEEFVKLFERYCPSLGKIRSINSNRIKAIIKFNKCFTIEEITEGLNKAEASDFLKGNTSSWKANFDWIIKESNFVKILEGNYDNRKSYSTHNSLNLKNKQTKDINEELDYSMKA